ncbi:ABC transporter ATP-binding protein [Salidesulfovibrio onnuriiensis]|uniref:ABC transporter ATP-binding protein n=1 Tax=Salidesulfovibrio onnuriiensis TaxID=2583823 RepID=UPI0011C8C6EE|nr:ABC transporter ATP-binding protein [Salidesulfovibrio onnuriiensis]
MLNVSNLSIEFSRYDHGLGRTTIRAVNGMDLDVQEGEIVAVAGSSGSGKSLLAHAVLGLLPQNAQVRGVMRFMGTPLTPRQQKKLRGREIALIPQSVGYLNPLATVGRQVYRAARLSGKCNRTAGQSLDSAFDRYRLQPQVKGHYPFQVSGGMARRVLTATATAGKARLIIADEPTTGLDPDVARESLTHLRELADEGKGVLLITHDLAAACAVADRVAVIYAGATVEITRADNFHREDALLHPYTRALWDSLPQRSFSPIAGYQPAGDETIQGCAFAPRCPLRTQECALARPELVSIHESRVRCFHARG